MLRPGVFGVERKFKLLWCELNILSVSESINPLRSLWTVHLIIFYWNENTVRTMEVWNSKKIHRSQFTKNSCIVFSPECCHSTTLGQKWSRAFARYHGIVLENKFDHLCNKKGIMDGWKLLSAKYTVIWNNFTND